MKEKGDCYGPDTFESTNEQLSHKLSLLITTLNDHNSQHNSFVWMNSLAATLDLSNSENEDGNHVLGFGRPT